MDSIITLDSLKKRSFMSLDEEFKGRRITPAAMLEMKLRAEEVFKEYAPVPAVLNDITVTKSKDGVTVEIQAAPFPDQITAIIL